MKMTVRVVEEPQSWKNPAATIQRVGSIFRSKTAVMRKAAEDLVRDRVQREGVGADGSAVAGYSTQQVWVSQQNGLKPKRRPRHAKRTQKLNNRNNWVGLYPGGYKQYREAIGLRTDGFFFSNFGTAWRHFGAVSTPTFRNARNAGFFWRVEIGFRRREDQIAASEAEQRRPLLFKVGRQEAFWFAAEHVVPAINDAMRQAFSQ